MLGFGDPTFKVSIHALVKRATTAYRLVGDFGEVSIHALVKRATCNPAS